MSLRMKFGVCAVAFSLAAGVANAETFDFGGSPERFSGNGDRKPPRCQINIPRAAQSSFFVQWNCTDDQATPDQIRTSLWIQRPGERAPDKLKEFLGFPASIFIDEGVLRVENFTDGLPAAFRLVAEDRAGTSAISPFYTVVAQDNSVDTCSLELETEGTESDGGTTGIPSERVLASDVSVTTEQVGNNDVRVTTFAAVNASPCEIGDVCSNDEKVTFESSLALLDGDDGTTSATGTVIVSPGNVGASVEGSAVRSSSSLTSLEVSGMTVIDGVPATVTLTCQQ
ncbi:MAG: hypothetical protein KDD69_06960 [Bdellovibrionales bacterium]|nr:hypothetical protein [Bdellovibrionales bacterium]